MSFFKKLGESSIFARNTPQFWHNQSLTSELLLPLSVIYFLGKRLFSSKHSPQKFNAKIVCIGNAIAGGSGKTPTAIAIHQRLHTLLPQAKIAFITTGFRGTLQGPILVDKKHTAKEVGDETILLSTHASVIMAKNRATAVEYAVSQGFEYLILDDGLHDKRIQKDITFLVIDGKYGFGNHLLIPAGPLRDRLDYATEGTDYVIMIGEDERKALTSLQFQTSKKYPVLKTYIDVTEPLDEAGIYVAFAGLGRPEKFFNMLKNEMNLVVPEVMSFPDHHKYTSSDIDELEELAKSQKAQLVTTEKDYIKLPPEFAAKVKCVKIKLQFDDREIDDILLKL